MQLPITAFLVFCLLMAVANVAYAIRRGRISWGRSFTKVLWAEREDSPDLFWLMVAVNALICAALLWLLLTRR
jgi:hypothetical protein